MKYLDTKRNVKYLVKSSLITFGAVFLPIFATLVAGYDLSGISTDQITVTAVSSGVVVVIRLAIIATAMALQKLIVQLKK